MGIFARSPNKRSDRLKIKTRTDIVRDPTDQLFPSKMLTGHREDNPHLVNKTHPSTNANIITDGVFSLRILFYVNWAVGEGLVRIQQPPRGTTYSQTGRRYYCCWRL